MITTEPPRTLGTDLVDATLETALARSAALEAELHRTSAALPGTDRRSPYRRSAPRPLHRHLANRVRLQNLGVPTYVVVADYQVITDRDAAGPLRDRVRSLVADHLAVGIDPARTVMFPHSSVPALNQLILPFLSLVTDQELRRNPTVKAELVASARPMSALLLTYPVHQAADILCCGGTVVPGRPRPTPAPRVDQGDREAIQRAVRTGVRHTCSVAVRRPDDPRHGRREDEQEPGQRDRVVRHRGRDCEADPRCAHRFRTG